MYFPKDSQTRFYVRLIDSAELLECVASQSVTQSVGSVTFQSRVNGQE
jgi:hypothetical protein